MIYDYYMEAGELELIAAQEYYERAWKLQDSPFAKAHYYLKELNLFRRDNADGLKMGDLEFIFESVMHYGYTIGVKSEDPLTASLLQARLLELGQNTLVEMVEKT